MTTSAAGLTNLTYGGGIPVEAEICSIQNGLEELLSWSTQERVERGEAALQMAIKHYDWQILEQQYVELYTSL